MKLLLPVVAFATLVAGEAWSACANPSATAGAMMWNADYAVVQVCNGTSWVALGGNGNDGSGEVDPQVGTLTDGQWCTASGGVVNCTSDAPLASISLDGLTDVTLTTPGLNNILRHDGTGWVNTPISSLISATGDRITSGTLTISANDSGYVSLTTASSTWGYLGSSGSYLPRISTGFASATTVSASYIQIPSATTALVCDAGVAGTMRYTSGTMQLCNGTSWGNIGLGLPAGAISAFATSSCPAGWTEYTPARGRFLRGIDNGAGNDPSGTRVAGSAQADELKSHTHETISWLNPGGGAGGFPANAGGFGNVFTGGDGNIIYSGQNGFAIRTFGGAETRPKNVAVTFCQYAGFGSELASGITTLDGLADVMVGGATAGQVLAFDGASWVPSNTTAGSGALGDRITSGTTSVVAQVGGAISITTNGVTSAYWDAAGRLIGGVAGFGTSSPSATVHVSGTIMAKMAANDRACPPEQWGAMRFNETTKRLQICRQPE
jgi:hypothetical protein